MLERDWSFLERYHDEALEMVPKKYRSFTLAQDSNGMQHQ